MKRSALIATLAIAALGLSACDVNERDNGMVNSKICADFKTTNTAQSSAPPATAANDPAAPVEECLRRWAYSLAGAHDSANIVGEAVVAACGSALTHWNQASLSQPSQLGPGGPNSQGQGVSLLTGRPTDPLAEHNAFVHARALFYVVQARAGRCAPPPVNNGVPVGT
jgi:hypothetical protein